MDSKGYFDSPEFRELLRRYEQEKHCSYFAIEELHDIMAFYLFQERIDAAEEIVVQARHTHPGSTELAKMEVKLLLSKGYPDEAMLKLNDIGYSDDDDTKLLHAEVLLAMKDYKNARDIAIEILGQKQITKETACEALELLLDCGFAQDALEITEYAIRKHPKQKCFTEIKAECLIELQYTDEAIAIYNELLDSSPYATFYWEQLAHTYYMVNRYGKALECFDYELTISDDIEYARMMQGYCYYFLHDYKRAMDIFTGLTGKYPSSAMPRFYTALCYYALGRKQEALDTFDIIIELTDDGTIENMLARVNRATLLYELGWIGTAEGALSLALLTHPQNMKQLLLSNGPLYELRDKENLTFKEMNVLDIKDWSAGEELFALARHFMKHKYWELAKSTLLYTRNFCADTTDTDACIAYTMFLLADERESIAPYIASALDGKSGLLFELFNKPYDANISTDEFLASIKLG